MSDGDLQIVLWVGGIGLTLIGGLASAVFMLLMRDRDRSEDRGEGRDRDHSRAKERMGDKQSEQAQTIAGVSAQVTALDTRVEGVEDAMVKIADALERIAKLETWRELSSPRLDDADNTSRAMVGIAAEVKTIFKRQDVTDAKIDAIGREQGELPRKTAELLRTMIRPIEGKAA